MNSQAPDDLDQTLCVHIDTLHSSSHDLGILPHAWVEWPRVGEVIAFNCCENGLVQRLVRRYPTFELLAEHIRLYNIICHSHYLNLLGIDDNVKMTKMLERSNWLDDSGIALVLAVRSIEITPLCFSRRVRAQFQKPAWPSPPRESLQFDTRLIYDLVFLLSSSGVPYWVEANQLRSVRFNKGEVVAHVR